MEFLPGPARDEIALEPVLTALADPIRLRIVATLSPSTEAEASTMKVGEHSGVGMLPGEHGCKPGDFGVEIGKPTLSHHLRVLREAGVTATRVDGRNRWIRLRRDDLDARFPGLLTAILTELATRE